MSDETTRREITLEDIETADKLVALYIWTVDQGSNLHKSYETEPYRRLEGREAFTAGMAGQALGELNVAIFSYLLVARHAPHGEFAEYALQRLIQRAEQTEFSVKR